MSTPALRIHARPRPAAEQRRDPEALVLVLDTHAPSVSAFQHLRDAAARLARTRLIYSVSRDDLVAVVRSGAALTRNPLNRQQRGGYKRIHVVVPPVSASLHAVRALARSVPGHAPSNLLNVLDVAGFLLSQPAAKRARRGRLIFFTPGRCVYRALQPDDLRDFEQLCALFAQERIRVDVVYQCSPQLAQRVYQLQRAFPHVRRLPVQQLIRSCRSNELAFLYMITAATGGHLLPFDDAVPLVDTPTPPIKRASAKFRGVLNIAGVVKIPVKRFSHVYAAKHPAGKKLSWNASKATNRPVPVLTETQRVASASDDTPLPKEHIINAYPYGPELVPEGNHVDQYAWHIQLERGLDVIGFVPRRSVPQTMLLSQVDVVLPMAACQPSVRLMRSLVLALAAENMGILARYVAAERGAPALAYLWPAVEVDCETSSLHACYLFMANVPMKEDVRHFSFATLDDAFKHVHTDAVRAMDAFISAALADTDQPAADGSDDEDDNIWPPELCNPNLDWFHTCVVHRALAGADATDFPPLAPWHEQMMDPMHFLSNTSTVEQLERCLADLHNVLPLTPAPQKTKKFKPVHQAVAGDEAALEGYLPKDETELQDKADEEDREEGEDAQQVIYNHQSFRDMDEMASLITDSGVEDVSEASPESDFANLVRKGHFRFASRSMIVVIQRLIRDDKDIDKAIRCIKVLKEAGISNKEPRVFNDFVSSLVGRSSQDSPIGKKTKAFFRKIGTRGEAESVNVIPFMTNLNENSTNPSYGRLRQHLERLSSKVKQLISEGKEEPLSSAIQSATE